MPPVKSFKVRKGTKINRYTVRDCLGRGWEGEVYRVTEEFSRAQRVLKLFDPGHYRSDHMYRYCPKLEKLSPVPGMIRFYHADWWERHNCYYLVMEWREGKPLDTFSRLPLFQGLRVIRDLLRIVRDCHAMNCCVGDIHSGNVILAATGRPYIIDVDLGSKLSRKNAAIDRTAVCKLFYELTRGPYTPDLRQALPKHADALTAKYKSTNDVLRALDVLMGREATVG